MLRRWILARLGQLYDLLDDDPQRRLYVLGEDVTHLAHSNKPRITATVTDPAATISVKLIE